MKRFCLAIAAITVSLGVFAGPAVACGGLVGENGTIQLVRTATLAAYHDGVERYVTSFEFVGDGAEVGSIIPLPDVPTEVVRGAIGAIVLVDTQRLEECFSAVDYFESNGVPFIVAVNAFNGQMHHSSEAVRDALAIPADVPLIRTDARLREATKAALLELVQHALLRASAQSA